MVASPSDLQVLVADDQPDCRADLRTMLAPLGLAVEEAGSGEEALDLLHAKPVHLFVCDMHMPKLTGLETVQLARRIRLGLPCILVSGQVDPALMKKALEAQVYSVLGKPISRFELIYTLNRVLAKTYGTDLTPRQSPTSPLE